MPRTCSICRHAERGEVEAAIAQGESYRGIASRWELSDSAVARHASNHLAKALTLAREMRTLASGLAAADLLDVAATKAAERLLTASPGRDTDAAIATACRVVEAQSRLEAKQLGRDGGIQVSPETIEALLADAERASELSDRTVEIAMAGGAARGLVGSREEVSVAEPLGHR